MKKAVFTLVALMGFGWTTVVGQQSSGDSVKPVGFYGGVINELIFTKSSSQVKDHYSLGTELGLRFNDKFFLGLYYLQSIVPSDLWKTKPEDGLDLRQVHYGLSGSYRHDFGGLLYSKAGVRGAYADIKQEYTVTKDNGTTVNKAKSRTSSIVLSPDLKIGAHLTPWLDLEAGATYRFNFKNNEKWGISTKDFNGLGGTLSVIAKF